MNVKCIDISIQQEDQQPTTSQCSTKDFLKIDKMDYEDFFEKYLQTNTPCLLSSAHTASWPSRRDWTRFDCDKSKLEPDLDAIHKILKQDCLVPVSDCDTKEFNSHCSACVKFSEFKQYWQSLPRIGCRYLKDWHFYRDTKTYYEGYTTPAYFCSDWLNEWWQSRTDINNDYRFVYIGPENSWTPLHSDVFGSFSWSANIVGRKKWIFFVPGEEDKLRDKLGNLIFDADCVVESNMSTLNKIEIIQDAGEIIFVP